MTKYGLNFNKIYSIIEVEDLNFYLKDFDPILEDIDLQLTEILSQNKLRSLKTQDVKNSLASIVKYDNSLKTMKKRITFFAKNQNDKVLTSKDKELLKDCKIKIKNFLSITKKLISKCDDYLYNENSLLEN